MVQKQFFGVPFMNESNINNLLTNNNKTNIQTTNNSSISVNTTDSNSTEDSTATTTTIKKSIVFLLHLEETKIDYTTIINR